MAASGILLAVAACMALLFGSIGASWLFERALEKRRSQRAVGRAGGESFLARLLADGIRPLKGVSAAILSNLTVQRFIEKLANELGNAGYRTDNVSLASVLGFGLMLLGVLVYALSSSLIGGFAAIACGLLGVNGWLVRKQEQRRLEMREEIPEALQSMKACFQVGYSLSQTVHEVAASAKGPLGALFSEVEGNLETGSDVRRALLPMRADGSEPELVFLATALEIQHKTGGSMQRILEAARQSVVDELDLKRTLRTQTAQAKLSAQIVTAMPFALIGVFSLVSPGFLDPFFESAAGLILLAVAIGIQIAGISLVRRLLKVEVA